VSSCLVFPLHSLLTCPFIFLGEGAVALRAFLPNEQSWVLTLLHTIIQPKLLGTHTMQRVLLGISDQVSYEDTLPLVLTLSLNITHISPHPTVCTGADGMVASTPSGCA
jgi:hypothetical protein